MTEIQITNHPLAHIPGLKVDAAILDVRFGANCSMMQCKGTCCHGGVWADIAERNNILNHIDIVHKYMDPDMEKDQSMWFDSETALDSDFASGFAVGTSVREDRCVFLTRGGLCVLQKADMGENDPALKLKPFYCKTFPVAIQNGVVIYDDYMKDTQPQCCSPNKDGELDIFDVCTEELELVLGKEGLEELKQAAETLAR